MPFRLTLGKLETRPGALLAVLLALLLPRRLDFGGFQSGNLLHNKTNQRGETKNKDATKCNRMQLFAIEIAIECNLLQLNVIKFKFNITPAMTLVPSEFI